MGSRGLLRALAVCASLPLIQCGSGSNVASKVNLAMIPKSPVVILSDFTLNPGATNEQAIKGPWFAVTYKVINNSDKDIVIQSLLFKITAVTTSGNITTKTSGIDPADYAAFFCPAHTPTYLDVVPAGTTIYAGAGGDPTRTSPCFLTYVHTLEKNVQNYAYQVEVQVQGWIGTPTLPSDRFEKSIYFFTQ